MHWFRSRGSSEEREQDLAREIEAHLRAEAEEQVEAGVSVEDGRAAALRQFGNVALVQEDVRAAWGYRWLDTLLQDLRYGARGLRRNPGFALVIVLCLALGIGANTAIFSVLNAVLLRPLPVDHPEQIYALDITESKFRAPQRFSYPLFEQMRDVAGDRVAAMTRVARMYGRVDGESAPETERVQLISGEYFTVLGLSPALGRLLTSADNRAVGEHPVAVLSHAFWQRKFGRSPDALGGTVKLNGTVFTIIGVAPAGFNGLWLESPVDLWIPVMMQSAVHYQQNFSSSNSDPDQPWPGQQGIRWLDVLVRTPGPLPALSGVFAQWLDREAAHMGNPADRAAFVHQKLLLDPIASGYSSTRGQLQAPLYVLAGMVALVLLIACANAANLMLARGAARKREIAVRLMIGASRGRVMRQLLTETFLLVAIAAALGVAAAYLCGTVLLRAALGITTAATPIAASLDWRVLTFSIGVAIATTLVAGFAPAWRTSDVDLDAATKSGMRGGAAESFRAPQKVLVAAQIALVFVLLVGAAWFSSSLRYLANLNLGYDQDQVVTIWIRPDLAGYSQDQLPALHRRLVEGLEALPGVQSAAYAACGLASGCRNTSSVTIEGYQPAADENVEIQENRVGLRYFTTVGMRLLGGRDFTERDSAKAPPVAILNETAVRRYFSGRNAIGRRLGYGQANIEVVGVVSDARFNNEREPARPMAFYPLAQATVFGGSIQVRFAGDATARVKEIREAMTRIDPNLPLDSVRTVRDQVNGNMRRDRLIVWLASAFGVLALVLGCFGVYGTMSYAVARRTSEIGIRMALGAAPGRVFRLTLGESLVLLAAGLTVGAPLVMAVARPASQAVPGVNVGDPWIPLFAALVVGATATLAAYVPARRASRVDPMVALRNE